MPTNEHKCDCGHNRVDHQHAAPIAISHWDLGSCWWRGCPCEQFTLNDKVLRSSRDLGLVEVDEMHLYGPEVGRAACGFPAAEVYMITSSRAAASCELCLRASVVK